MVKYNATQATQEKSMLSPVQVAVGLAEARESLAQHMSDMTEIDGMIDHATIALNILDNFKGQESQAIALVNHQHAMESLLGVAESKITVSAAREGLGDALKTAWEKFKVICKKIWQKIKEFFSRSNSACQKAIADAMNKLKQLKNGSSKGPSTEALHDGESFKLCSHGFIDARSLLIAMHTDILSEVVDAYSMLTRLASNTATDSKAIANKTAEAVKYTLRFVEVMRRHPVQLDRNFGSAFENKLIVNNPSFFGRDYPYEFVVCTGRLTQSGREKYADNDLRTWNDISDVNATAEQLHHNLELFKHVLEKWDALKSFDLSEKLSKDISDRDALTFFKQMQDSLSLLARFAAASSSIVHQLSDDTVDKFFKVYQAMQK